MHEIGDDSGIVPHERFFGVGGVLADLLVGVAESTTDRLGVPNLHAGFEEVLTLEDILWGELTKVLRGRNLTGEEGRRETSTLVHTTTDGVTLGHGGSRGRAGGRRHTERRILTLGDGVP